MREIRFRGKRVSDGKWVYGYYLASDDKHYIIDCCGVTSTAIALADNIASFPGYHEVIPETVGQYTGLKDKNDKEIYEGDILHYEDAPFDNQKNHVVKCFPGHFVCCGIMGQAGIDDTACYPEAEIIGNIHDNSELLENPE